MVGGTRGTRGTGGRRRQLGLLTLLLVVVAAGGWSLDRLREQPATTPPRAVATSAVATSAVATGASATPGAPAGARATLPPPPSGHALAALDGLAVDDRPRVAGYDRTLFGQAWLDTDRNGCDTRNDVLRRDLRAAATRPGTHGCLVVAGTLLDPYTGQTLAFRRGPASGDVQVDHVVALADAWQTGADSWSTARRATFANDPLELLAVAGVVNQAKGDGDAASWLPPATAYRCPYAARQVAVKLAYGLSVTTPERDALADVLRACPDEPLPARGAFVLAPH